LPAYPNITLHRYTASGFLKKNQDPLPSDVKVLFRSSNVGMLFNPDGSFEKPPPMAGLESGAGTAGRNTANRKAATVGSQYKISLKLLIDKMSQCRWV
jgi:myosin heavy subunit